MSLLSQRDHELSIKALEYYYSWVKDESEKREYRDLINWIRLQHQKNEV